MGARRRPSLVRHGRTRARRARGKCNQDSEGLGGFGTRAITIIWTLSPTLLPQFDLAKYTHRRTILNPGKLKYFNRASIERKIATLDERLIGRARGLVTVAEPNGSVKQTGEPGRC